MAFRWANKVEVIGTIRRHAEQFPSRLGTAMREEVEIDLTEVKRRTPVDTGDLRNSEHVEGPTYKGKNVTCTMVAGGITAEYAGYVHEDLEAFHKVGQAKYMESVMNESAPYIGARIAVRLKAETEK